MSINIHPAIIQAFGLFEQEIDLTNVQNLSNLTPFPIPGPPIFFFNLCALQFQSKDHITKLAQSILSDTTTGKSSPAQGLSFENKRNADAGVPANVRFSLIAGVGCNRHLLFSPSGFIRRRMYACQKKRAAKIHQRCAVQLERLDSRSFGR